MQSWLFGNALIDWLVIFCMMHTMFRGNVISWDRYRYLLSMPDMKHEVSCIVRKGEKQIQILDDY
jgi:hypothetical protein